MKRKSVTLTMMDQYWLAHIDVKDAITYITMTMKYYYNQKHKPLYFKMKDLINLHLHKSYTLPSLKEKNKKLRQQFVSLLKVLNCVEKLTYWLELSSNWCIHDVISVAHLEPAHTNDPYWRPRPEEPKEVIVNDEKKWEVKKLLFKRTYQRGRDMTTEYLACWLEYGSEFDSWVNIRDLGNAKELVWLYELRQTPNA